ncbi:6376_t:CDS:2 [Paraglomus brasilianum]|uniref:6376_t:CDS:1 n=1 Tax=Paraglomus brasilianum TaxID=144538 RepID=A0A9N9CDI4_9GLOM|nr:6376_t:CDS:2 [Paraglomus brasilianum]
MKVTVVKFLFILVIIVVFLESGIVLAHPEAAKFKKRSKRSPLPQAKMDKKFEIPPDYVV